MAMIENQLYLEDVSSVASLDLPWQLLEGCTVLIAGATGLIGTFLTDVLMYRNREYAMECSIAAMSRREEEAARRFFCYGKEPLFHYFAHDVNKPLKDMPAECFGGRNADYVLHLACNTHPVAYATDPIGTITANITGSANLLEYAAEHNAKRFLFASSNEIYGENRGDTELFSESCCGYLDCGTLRAGYPESKRCAEALCQAYRKQTGIEVVIPRLTRTYGPTLRKDDTKALSQFLRCALEGRDIVLKSDGMQYYSFAYAADSVSGLLTVLLKGEDGNAYNVADESSDIRLRDLAELIAGLAGKQVVYEAPGETEKTGFSKATKARLDGSKLKGLGWSPMYDIRSGTKRTLDIMRAERL